MRRLILNADDFGLAPGVNRGIIEAHDAGTLSSASMMVNTPAFAEAAALARARAPSLQVGLHFNLLLGRPVSAVPTLTDPRTGEFYSLAELGARALVGSVSADEVRRECDAQLAALAQEGIAVTHVDSHRHTHALPGILPAVTASARSAGVQFVRRPLDEAMVLDAMTSAKSLALHVSWRAALRGVDVAGRALLARAPVFRGLALQGAADFQARLLALFDRLPRGTTEVMTHPGHDDAVLAAQDTYRLEREAEVRALCSTAVRERLSRGDILLVNFGTAASV